MKYIFSFLIALIPYVICAQQEQSSLTDTVEYIIEIVNEINSQKETYEIFRLNFDDCNLEIHQTFKTDSSRWNIHSFWLSDLNKDKLRLINQPHGEWSLILNSYSNKIRYDTEKSSGYRKSVVLFGESRDSLMHLGKAIYFAITMCQEQDRGKD